MPDLAPRNLSAIRSGNYTPQQLHDCLADIVASHNYVAQQLNASPVGVTPPPQPHASLSVKGGAGILDVAVSDDSPQYRGKEHFFDYSMDNWQTVHTKSMGPAKNWRGSLGSGTFQVRSYSQYATSGPSPYVFSDPVDATGATEPDMQAGQGSGTGDQGYGGAAYNAPSPPKR